jgi:hypothetical protein
MVNQPDQDMEGLPTPSGKLVLPAPPDEGQYLQPYTVPIRSESLIRHTVSKASSASHGLLTKFTTLWRKDPAYRILSLAIALVVVASVVFVALGARALMDDNGGLVWNQAYTQHPGAAKPAGTVDNKPAFPAPSTGQSGSDQSSQPVASPTPDLQPTSTSASTPTPASDPTPGSGPGQPGNLQVQVTSVPSTVSNDSRVNVDVQTNQPNVTVTLEVTYSNAYPSNYTSGSRTTDDSGNASLAWAVRIFSAGSEIQATVVVIARDQNGQEVVSQPQTVTVVVQ